jgi:hypothetical protein
MGKKSLCIMVVVLTVSSVTLAGGFAGGQMNGSFRIGPYSTGTSIDGGSVGCPKSGASGGQAASTQGCTGTGAVIQTQCADGSQSRKCGSQKECLSANQSQGIINTGKGSASGSQFGSAGQTQNHYSCAGTSNQAQTAAGGQIGTTTGTNCGSIGTAGAMGGIDAFQCQKF